MAFIPLAGVQNDEALFAVAIYKGMTRDLRLFHHSVQLMVMSYLGALKTWLWWPLLRTLGGNLWTLRLPAVLTGGVVVILFHRFMRLAGIPLVGATAAALLLSTDPSFLISNTFDWGPVVLEHFLLLAGCLCLLQFSRNAGNFFLFLGFFAFGLALWNKAIFVWALAGVTVATLAVFRQELVRLYRPGRAAIALGAFLLGASPLILYNLRHRSVTLRDNAQLEPIGAAFEKWHGLRSAANGDALVGYLTMEEWNEHPKPVATKLGKASSAIRELVGQRRGTYFFYVLGALLLAAPLWWRSRAAWFALIFCAVAWASMAITRDAGSSLHHTVLLWPFPFLFVAVSFSKLGRWCWIPTAAMVLLNLLVLNQHIFLLEKYGTGYNFSDAIFPLADAVQEQDGRTIWVTDWGMFNSLVLLSSGHGDMRTGNEPFMSDQMEERSLKQALSMTHEGDLFVDHVAGQEVFEGVRKRLDGFMKSRGFEPEVLQTISDSNGRPVFEIFRLKRQAP
jgi:4-amino-4-deoxy-L-arabinose transferase-like glycosyltransferase